MPRLSARLSAPVRTVLVLCAAVTLGALAVALWRQARVADLPTGRAEWIWRDVGQAVGPTAFYAVRDFSLPERPREARLLVLADEEYVLTLNGRRVGSNRYRPGAPLDVYPVDDLLLEGPNRLLVELRSSRGAGGFLAALEVDDGAGGVRRPVVTDRSWRLVLRHRPGLREGWAAVDPGAPQAPSEPPVTWGRPPTGRWGLPERGAERPVASRAGDPCDEIPASDHRGGFPRPAVFDFGREVTGYLVLRHPPGEGDGGRVEAALFATGRVRPPRPLRRPAAAVPLVPMPGSSRWTDAVPRRFRYATVVGFDGPLAAAVLPVSPDALPALPGSLTGEAAAPSVLGVPLAGRKTPTEDQVRRRLLEEGD